MRGSGSARRVLERLSRAEAVLRRAKVHFREREQGRGYGSLRFSTVRSAAILPKMVILIGLSTKTESVRSVDIF